MLEDKDTNSAFQNAVMNFVRSSASNGTPRRLHDFFMRPPLHYSGRKLLIAFQGLLKCGALVCVFQSFVKAPAPGPHPQREEAPAPRLSLVLWTLQ
jgi:hypothetical protein